MFHKMNKNTVTKLHTVKTRPLIKDSLLALSFWGISPYDQNIWSKIKAITVIIMLTYLTVELLIQFLVNWKGWESVEGFTLFTSLVQMTFKPAFMFLKKKQFLELLQHIEKFWSWDSVNEDLRRTFEDMAASVIKAIEILRYSSLATLSMYLLRPLLENNRTLPFDTYHPKERNSNYYIPMYVLQAIDPALGVFCVLPFDSLFISFVIHIICQLKIMKHRFLTMKVNLNVNGDDQNCLLEFSNLIQHHILVLRCVNIVVEIYSGVLLGQFASSVTCICSGLLSMVAVGFPPDFQHLVKYTTFMSALLFQLFIYCVTGTFLMEETFSLSEAVYECEWWAKTQPKLRRACILIIQRAQKRETLKAGAIFPLHLETFTIIVKFFLSFFTVAQSVYTKTTE